MGGLDFLTDEFIKATVEQAKRELEAEEKEENMMGESELQMTDEAQEVHGAIRGGTGDIDDKEEPKQKRKYTKHAAKNNQKVCQDKQQIIPDSIRQILRQELDKCEEEIENHRHEIALLDMRMREIKDFLGIETAEVVS